MNSNESNIAKSVVWKVTQEKTFLGLIHYMVDRPKGQKVSGLDPIRTIEMVGIAMIVTYSNNSHECTIVKRNKLFNICLPLPTIVHSERNQHQS